MSNSKKSGDTAPWWSKPAGSEPAAGVRARYNPHVADTLSPVGRVLAPVLTFLTTVTMLGVFVAASSGSMFSDSPGPYGSRSYIPNTSAVIAGCGMIFEFFPQENQYGLFNYEDIAPRAGSEHIRIPVTPMRVPAYGYMVNNERLNHEDYFIAVNDEPPPLESILRAMYDGAIILWYLPNASESTVEQVQRLARSQENVIAIPWRVESLGLPTTLRTHEIPDGREFAFSSWAVTQSCEQLTEDAFLGFIEFATEKSPLRPSDPPWVELTSDAKLPGLEGEFSGAEIP